jgi:5-methylcytosine-specific restriction enzyme subunit McrC
MSRHLAIGLPEHTPVHRLIPDILIESSSGRSKLVADTKYKRLVPNRIDMGVDISDLYQMIAYANAFHCPQMLLIYPSQSEQSTIIKDFNILDGTGRLTIATVDLHRPLNKPDPLIQELHTIFTSMFSFQEVESYGAPI